MLPARIKTAVHSLRTFFIFFYVAFLNVSILLFWICRGCDNHHAGLMRESETSKLGKHLACPPRAPSDESVPQIAKEQP
jgi:hypothetical protein